MVDQLSTSPTPEQLTDRAWLLGKMQTSLMRDGWQIGSIDPEAGVLTVLDGGAAQLIFEVSLSLPERQATTSPAKKTSPKRKR